MLIIWWEKGVATPGTPAVDEIVSETVEICTVISNTVEIDRTVSETVTICRTVENTVER